MDKLKFEEIRKELLKECYERSDGNIVSSEFKNSFFKLIEYCTFTLMEQKENFFAHFIIQLKREIFFELPTATASRIIGTYYVIYFNPSIFLECSIEEMKALLKHEVYHIISLHHIRAKSLQQLYSSKAVNLAMDIAVNQYISSLPLWCESLENVSLSYNIMLKEEATVEEYAKLIQEAMDTKKKDKLSENKDDKPFDQDISSNNLKGKVVHDIERAHDIWGASNFDIDNTQIKEITKKLVQSSIRGEISESIGKLIADFNATPELDWKNYLKRLIGTIPNGSKRTITRRDRRQPERLEIRGKLNKQSINIIVAIDISGSMNDEEIEKIMVEVISIAKNFNYELNIIECDNEIRRVYVVKKLKDIKEKLNTRGGTRFTPVFEYINKNYSNDCLLIYFTDGIGERELNLNKIHKRVLWVLTGESEELSLNNPPGIVKKLTVKNKSEQNILALEYLKNELKDIRTEWAK